MADEDQTSLLPEWRQAVKDFLAARLKEGDIVTHGWLVEHFGMPKVDENKPLLPAEWNAREFEWLKNIEAFRSELLEKHSIYLSNVFGQGYRVVPPREQTAIVQDRFEREAKRSFRKAAIALKHIRVGDLTEDERRENLDAIARLSQLRGMHRAVE